MNYLAHAYLSFNNTQILLGNMCSDFIKGKNKFDYNTVFQKGIFLHRAIDTFTDAHAATATAKQYLKPAVGLYAGAFIDVVYDHFLAVDKNEFYNSVALEKFSLHTYNVLQQHLKILPLQFQTMFLYMQKQNWLYNYQFTEGIEKSFEALVKRARYLSSWKEPFEAFNKHYYALHSCYTNFFPQVKNFARLQLEQLLNN